MTKNITEPSGDAVVSAPFGVRALARVADLTVLNGVCVLLLCAYAVPGAAGFSAVALLGWIAGAYGLFCIAYFTLGTSEGRQTLGHRLARLQVVRTSEADEKVSLARALGRTLVDLFFLGLLGYGIGFLDYLPIAITPAKRALHDLAAGTRVVQLGRPNYAALSIWAASLLLVPVVGVFLVIRPVFMQAFYVPSAAMEPTLSPNDGFLVNKIFYRLHHPQRGDIVVFHPPAEVMREFPEGTSSEFVKRIVGLPGDELRLAGGHVYLYGQSGPLSEPYLRQGYSRELPVPDGSDEDDWFERRRSSLTQHSGKWWIRVPAGQYFVLGDNRNDSNDSHLWGFLPGQSIVGKATLLYRPRLADL